MSTPLLMDSILWQMLFLFLPDRNLAVTELNALQCQDKNAPKKTFQRRRKQRSRSEKRKKENLPHHLKAEDVEKGEPRWWRFHPVSSWAASGNREKKERKGRKDSSTRLWNFMHKKGHGLNRDVSWCRRRFNIPCEEDAGHFRNVGGN